MKGFHHPNRFVLLLLLTPVIVTASCIAIISEKGDDGGGGFREFRAEGLSLREAAPAALKYLKKYYHKDLEAPDSLKIYFATQAALLNEIANNSPPGEKVLSNEMANNNPPGEKLLSMAFVGDIMWIRNGWDTFLDDNVRLYLQQFDMVFGNLETPVDTTVRVPSLLPDYAKYNSAPGLIRSFRRENGNNIFTALSLANNHAFDRGATGLANTRSFLDGEGILSTGASAGGPEAPEYLLLEKNGLRIGFYASSWGLNNPETLNDTTISLNFIPGIAPLNSEEIDLSRICSVLDRMKDEGVDFRILFMHWGYEYELYPDPAIMETGRKLATAGADLVIGSHSHLVQPAEIWSGKAYTSDSVETTRNSLIVYSLGNFTTAMYTPLCRLGPVISVNLFKDPATGTTDWAFRETKYVYNKPPGRKPGGRKLMLFDDYMVTLESNYPGEARRIREKTRPVTEH